MRLIRDGIVDREGVEGLAGAAGLQHAPAEPPRHRRGRHRPARAGAGSAQPDRAHPARDDGPHRGPCRLCRRVRQRAPVQRDGASGLCRHTDRTACSLAQDHSTGVVRPAMPPKPSICASHAASLSTRPRSSTSSGTRALPGVEQLDGTSYRRSLRLPHGHGVVTLSTPAGRRRGPLGTGVCRG